MNGLNKGIRKVEVSVKWDPSPAGQPPTDLDIVAATYPAADPSGSPAYVVHFDSRSPDGPAFGSRQVTYCTATQSSRIARTPGRIPAANSLPMFVPVMIP